MVEDMQAFPIVGHVRANIANSQNVLITICGVCTAALCDLLLCKEEVVIRRQLLLNLVNR